MAFLAEQRIAAITRTNALDGQVFREVHDETFVRVKVADGMQTFDEYTIAFDALECCISHVGHDAHVNDHVGTIRNFNATACIR